MAKLRKDPVSGLRARMIREELKWMRPVARVLCVDFEDLRALRGSDVDPVEDLVGAGSREIRVPHAVAVWLRSAGKERVFTGPRDSLWRAFRGASRGDGSDSLSRFMVAAEGR